MTLALNILYFKAGNYHVNSTANPSEFAEVTLYELENSHEGYVNTTSFILSILGL